MANGDWKTRSLLAIDGTERARPPAKQLLQSVERIASTGLWRESDA